MDNMQRLESQISMYHTIFMICIVLFVLFLLVDIFLFIKLDIRKVIGFLTGKTARKTIEEMKAGGGSAVAYAWYEFQKGYKGVSIIKWIN